jgi:hypothetical protein
VRRPRPPAAGRHRAPRRRDRARRCRAGALASGLAALASAIAPIGPADTAGAGAATLDVPEAAPRSAKPAREGRPPGSGRRTPARLLVTAEEWRLRLSRPRLRPGAAIVQLYNRGEDPHDLAIRRLGRTRVLAAPETEPGELSELRTTLRRGASYELWCSLPGHRASGMEAELRVRRRR